MTDFEKFNKHINKPFTFELEGDEFQIRQLPIEYLPELIKAQKLFQRIQDEYHGDIENEEDMLQAMEEVDLEKVFTKDILDACKVVTYETVRQSYPDLPDETLTQFVSDNFWTILGWVFYANQLRDEEGNQERVEEVKERLENLREKQNVQGETTGEEKTETRGKDH